ncbi:MAG TPA: GNAT family N-acetyltransferase, partial [Actinomycetota bacterium]|nr:GNAT family N-acetyltransferase [Actinomycetota bacterium]
CPGHSQPAELVKLYVARHRRRGGLGRALVDWAEGAARSQGATGMELWSDSRFAGAHRLYARCGWRPTGATRDLHDRSQTTELQFQKRLTAAGQGEAAGAAQTGDAGMRLQ